MDKIKQVQDIDELMEFSLEGNQEIFQARARELAKLIVKNIPVSDRLEYELAVFNSGWVIATKLNKLPAHMVDPEAEFLRYMVTRPV